MTPDRAGVFGGVDTHKDVHVAAAVDAAGRLLGTAEFAADSRGYDQLAGWLESWGAVGRVGVEGTGSYGAGLARHDELTATKQALRSLARRIKTLTAEAAELQTSIRGLVEAVAPHLLDQPGVGPITAAQVYIAWSHPGRCRNEAAFARLAGVAPLEASSGQNTRHRLNRRGDRQLNRALHTIAVTRSRYCPHTQAYIAKRTAQGKTPREAQRCLKRYIARQIYRLLQHPKINT